MAGTPFWGGAGAGGVGRLLTRLLKIFKQGKAPKPLAPIVGGRRVGSAEAERKWSYDPHAAMARESKMERLAKKASETGPSKWSGAKDFPKLADESPEFLARHGLFRSQGGKVFRSQDRPWETMSPSDLAAGGALGGGMLGAAGGGIALTDYVNRLNSLDPGWSQPRFGPQRDQQPEGPSLSPEQMLQLIAGQGTAPYSTEESPPPPGYMDYLLQQAFGRGTPGPMPMGMEREMRMNR
jgi:hypothetical protein